MKWTKKDVLDIRKKLSKTSRRLLKFKRINLKMLELIVFDVSKWSKKSEDQIVNEVVLTLGNKYSPIEVKSGKSYKEIIKERLSNVEN